MKKNLLETFQIPKAQTTPSIPSEYEGPTRRLSVHVDSELGEKIQDYVFWEGLTQQQIILQALLDFLLASPDSVEEVNFRKGLEYVAKRMLAKEYKKEEIQEITGLSLQKIKSLQQ